MTETKQFIVKIAENEQEVEKALRLRYEVFTVEQKRGLITMNSSGLESDEYDEHCLHVLVLDKKSSRAVGTYRAHLGAVAQKARGFYSSREYSLGGIDPIAGRCLELGRSCVSPEFRTGAAIVLLWNAIAELLVRLNLGYMIGCVSLESTDPAVGWAIYEHLRSNGRLSNSVTAMPREDFRLARPHERDIERLLADKNALKKHISPLFKGYLRLGALICGAPALDKEFDTIDFFIIVDVSRVPERYVRHFRYQKRHGL